MWLNDLGIILGIVFNIGALFLTVFVMSLVSGIEGYAEYAKNVEANPTIKADQLLQFSSLISRFAIYGILVGSYLYFRKLENKQEREKLFIEILSTSVFFMGFFDFMNDFGIALGLTLAGMIK